MNVMPNRQELWLAPHAATCAIDGQVILLDLRRNRYLAVPESAAMSFEIGGWPPCSSPRHTGSVDSWTIARKLQSQGLLVDKPVPDPRRNILPDPARSVDGFGGSTQGCTPANVFRMFTSTAVAYLSLRHRSLDSISGSILARHRASSNPGCSDELDLLSATYARLRPLVFTSKDRCLLDSLALLRFLSHWELSATWVIGVKTRPFAAHSWLQSGTTVLNDHWERVRQYRPILVV